MKSKNNMFSLFLLGHLLQKTKDDAEISSLLVEKSNELVFNVDDLRSHENVQFLVPFYQAIGEETLIADILPKAQIVVKLDEKFIGHVATLADALKIELSVEAAKQLICEVVPRESLRQKNKEIDELFISVVAKQKKENIAQFVQVVIKDFVLAAFKEVCADLTADGQKKVNVIAKAFTCLKAMTGPDDAIVAVCVERLVHGMFKKSFI